jgi:hypothetical protein
MEKSLRLLLVTKKSESLVKLQPTLSQSALDEPLSKEVIAELMAVWDWDQILFPFFSMWLTNCPTTIGMSSQIGFYSPFFVSTISVFNEGCFPFLF